MKPIDVTMTNCYISIVGLFTYSITFVYMYVHVYIYMYVCIYNCNILINKSSKILSAEAVTAISLISSQLLTNSIKSLIALVFCYVGGSIL